MPHDLAKKKAPGLGYARMSGHAYYHGADHKKVVFFLTLVNKTAKKTLKKSYLTNNLSIEPDIGFRIEAGSSVQLSGGLLSLAR